MIVQVQADGEVIERAQRLPVPHPDNALVHPVERPRRSQVERGGICEFVICPPLENDFTELFCDVTAANPDECALDVNHEIW